MEAGVKRVLAAALVLALVLAPLGSFQQGYDDVFEILLNSYMELFHPGFITLVVS